MRAIILRGDAKGNMQRVLNEYACVTEVVKCVRQVLQGWSSVQKQHTHTPLNELYRYVWNSFSRNVRCAMI